MASTSGRTAAVVRVSDASGNTLAEIGARHGDTVGNIRQRLLHELTCRGFPDAAIAARLCCDGAVLSDDRQVLMPAHRELIAWFPRYSQSAVPPTNAPDGASAAVRAQMLIARASFDLRALATWLLATGGSLRRAAGVVAGAAASHPRLIAKLGVWCALFYVAHWRAELGGPFLVVSACWAVWQVGFSERREGEVSAYTVFNDGRALPGQLRQEDLQAQMVGM